MSIAVQRTMRALREIGTPCAVAEKFNKYGGEFGIRVDLFGIIDVVALSPDRGVIGIQCCTTTYTEHYRKLTEELAQNCIDWLQTQTKLKCPHCDTEIFVKSTKLEIWSWRKLKIKRGGKAVKWTPRIVEIRMEEFK